MSNQKEPECTSEIEMVRGVLENSLGEKNLIAILLLVQDCLGYLSEGSMMEIGRYLDISETTVYGVATFYNQFRFTPPGRRHIQVCMGTACHVKRGEIVLESWERGLGIQEGEVREDREFSLERVNCVGCCVLAPVTVINKEIHAQMDPTRVDGVLLKYKMEEEAKIKKEEPSETGEADCSKAE